MKKIIALVLFAAMLFALVPVASAATDLYQVSIPDGAVWWAAQIPNTVADPAKATKIGYDNGITVQVEGEKGKKVTDETTSSQTITLKVTGSYNNAEAHYYSKTYWTGAQPAKYVKIPFNLEVLETGSQTSAYLNSVMQFDLIEGNYYIDFDLSVEDRTEEYLIGNTFFGGLYPVKIKIVWDNTDNDPTPSAKGPHPSLKVVGYDSSAAQYGNFTADFKDMSKGEKGRLTFNIAAYTLGDRTTIWNASNALVATSASFEYGRRGWSDDIDDVYDYIERLLGRDGGNVTGITLDQRIWVAATGDAAPGDWVYRSDVTDSVWRATIRNNRRNVQNVINIAGERYAYFAEDDTMDVRLKAFDSSLVAYPAGTIIGIGKVQENDASSAAFLKYAYTRGWGTNQTTVWGWDEYLGKSSKYVNVHGEPTYLIDQQNSFVFSIDGITAFAMAAGYYRDVTDVDNAYTSEDIVLLYQNQYKLFQLVFTNGKTIEAVEFDIFFKNINRTKSGITVIGDREITVDRGTKTSLPYVLDDAYAMSKDLTEAWVSSDSKIVKVTNSKNGAIEAVGLGKAYIYAKDATGTFQIFIVNVVDAAAVVPEAPTTDYKTYVVTASNLYVRSGPGTNYKALGKLPRGTEVAGIEVDGSVWVQVNYNGTTAYMSGKYLAEK